MSKSETLKGTLKGTLFTTARSSGFMTTPVIEGLGSTIEVGYCDGEDTLSISGHSAVIEDIYPYSDSVADCASSETEEVSFYSNGYVTLTIPTTNPEKISRFQLTDFLNGSGWKLIGFSSVLDKSSKVQHIQIWSKSKKESKSRRSSTSHHGKHS